MSLNWKNVRKITPKYQSENGFVPIHFQIMLCELGDSFRILATVAPWVGTASQAYLRNCRRSRDSRSRRYKIFKISRQAFASRPYSCAFALFELAKPVCTVHRVAQKSEYTRRFVYILNLATWQHCPNSRTTIRTLRCVYAINCCSTLNFTRA